MHNCSFYLHVHLLMPLVPGLNVQMQNSEVLIIVPMFEKQVFHKVTYSWNEPWIGTWGRDWEGAQKIYCSGKNHWRYGRASVSRGDMHWGAAVFPFPSGLEWTSSKCLLLLYSKRTHLVSSKQKWGIHMFPAWISGIVQELFTSVGNQGALIILLSHSF